MPLYHSHMVTLLYMVMDLLFSSVIERGVLFARSLVLSLPQTDTDFFPISLLLPFPTQGDTTVIHHMSVNDSVISPTSPLNNLMAKYVIRPCTLEGQTHYKSLLKNKCVL